MPESRSASIAVAFIHHAGEGGNSTREAILASGARLVYIADTHAFDRAALAEAGADVVIVDLHGDDDVDFERLDALAEDYRVIFNDLEVSATLEGWDRARWQRHLIAKIVGGETDPPRPPDAEAIPAPVARAAVPEPVVAAAAALEAQAAAPAEPVADVPPVPASASEVDLAFADWEMPPPVDAAADADADAEAPVAAPEPLPVVDEQGWTAAEVSEALPPAGDVVDAWLAEALGAAMSRSAPAHEPPVSDGGLPEAEAIGDEPLPAFDLADLESTAQAAAETLQPGEADAVPELPDDLGFEDVVGAQAPEAASEGEAGTGIDDWLLGALGEAIEELAPFADEAGAASDGLTPFADEAGAASDELAPFADEAGAVSDGLAPFADEAGAASEQPASFAEEAGEVVAALPEAADFATASGEAVAEGWDVLELEPVPDVPASVGEGEPERHEIPPPPPFELDLVQEVVGDAAPPSVPTTPAEWSLEDVVAETVAEAPRPTDFGIEKIEAAEFLAPEAEPAPADDGTSLSGLSLELIPIEEAVAPSRYGETVHEARLESAIARISQVWVLGASVGGPEAVREFLGALPADYPAVFLLAQHMGGEFVGLMARQLAQATPLQVRTPSHGDRTSHGEVLIARAGQRLMVDAAGAVVVRNEPEEGAYAPSIDRLLCDVGDRFGAAAGAIIFSGIGDDGVEGCRHLAGRGGRVGVQRVDTCVASSMVERVQEAGVASFSGSPQELAQYLLANRA